MAIKTSWEPHVDSDEGSFLAEINIIPLVDVVLVLLIIFMVTVPMMKAGVDISLPRGENAAPLAEERVTVSLAKDGKIYIEDEPITEAALVERIQGIAAQGASVYLYADRGLPYGTVMEFMDTLKGAGIDTVALVMDQTPPVPKKKDSAEGK